MRFLVDTNVFLDLLLNREHIDDVSLFFDNCINLGNQIYISSMSIRDIEYLVNRAFHSTKKGREYIQKVYEVVDKVVSLSADSTINSIYSDVKDFEDSLLIETAKENLVDAIISLNVKDFNNSRLPVLTPMEMNSITSKLISRLQ